MRMLLLSTRLFLIASSYLVQGYGDKVKVTAPNIAERYKMNSRALMPSLRRLTQVGILKSQIGGREPGFILSRDPDDISMYEIITALEGEFKMASCHDLISDVECDIKKCENCTVYKIINKGILSTVENLKKTSLGKHHSSTCRRK